MLQLMVRRLRQTNYRFQLRDQAPAVKVVYTIVALANAYRQEESNTTDIVNLSPKDIADLGDVSLEDAAKVVEKLVAKGWVKPNPEKHVMHILNLNQMNQLLAQINSGSK
jgi:CRP/FNR family transcriptional regulator, cyclic AMP receptor protein